jgi:hypothetical protein
MTASACEDEDPLEQGEFGSLVRHTLKRAGIKLFDLGAATAGALFLLLMLTLPLLHLLGETTTSAVGTVGYVSLFGTLGVLSWGSNPHGRDLFNVGARAPDRTAETDRAALKALVATGIVAAVFSALSLWQLSFSILETLSGILLLTPIIFLSCYMMTEAARPRVENPTYPTSYTRTREFRGYQIDVEFKEWRGYETTPSHLRRRVKATATNSDGDVVATEASTAHAGVLPKTNFDPAIDADGNGVAAGEHTQQVLDRLHEDILTYEATGCTEQTESVDTALDIVFGEEPSAPLSSPETASGQEQEHEQEREWTVGDRS